MMEEDKDCKDIRIQLLAVVRQWSVRLDIGFTKIRVCICATHEEGELAEDLINETYIRK